MWVVIVVGVIRVSSSWAVIVYLVPATTGAAVAPAGEGSGFGQHFNTSSQHKKNLLVGKFSLRYLVPTAMLAAVPPAKGFRVSSALQHYQSAIKYY